ncbi:MAG: EAL domain-containing protein [Gammaproteobacteria bacterium]|nr:EAL domain-containing protein [Gammaproteobacteria bacterium]
MAKTWSSLKGATRDGTAHEVEYRIKRPDNEERWVYCKAEELINKSRHSSKLTGILQDITDRRIQDEQLRLAAAVYENTSEGVVITNLKAEIIDVNKAFSVISGYARDEVIGKNPNMLHSNKHDPNFYQEMWHAILSTDQWNGEIWNRRKNGSIYPEWLSISSIKNDNAQVTHYIGVFSDISEIKKTEEELYHLAHHDALTGLPNRLLLNEYLNQAIKRAKRKKTLIAVIFVDLDNFKNINDSFGHAAGDKLLKDVSSRLLNHVRDGDSVTRISGDEFIVVMEDIDREGDATNAAKKLISEFVKEFQIDSKTVSVTASLGISLYPQDGTDSVELLRNADSAMYLAKEDGRNTYQYYTKEMTANAFERVLLETSLRQAIDKNEFFLNYQPQIDFTNKNIIGAEALLRWSHPTLGIVSPAKFIPLAETSGLIIEIGDWVLRTACKQAKSWLDSGIQFGRIAVNIAGLQIKRGNLVSKVCQILDETGLPAKHLELEVTEGFIMKEAESAIKQLEEIRKLGILLAIDDFGTGYSSLSYLKKLPIHKLKIDQSFVRDIPFDNDDMAISKAVIALGTSLGLTIIAEGVETQQQAEFLSSVGCHQAQGYLYSRPLDTITAEKYFIKHRL